MQAIITSDDICDELTYFSESTWNLVHTWYAMVRSRGNVEPMYKRELEREIRGAIESRTNLSPERIIIDLNQNDSED